VRKLGRRAAEGKQTVPVVVKVSDGEGSNNADDAEMSTVDADADAAREQFPFIFNLLRGHAISSQALGSRPAAGQVSADNRRSKTSPHHQQQQTHQQHQPKQLPARKPAVATCRQHQATPPGRGKRALSQHDASYYSNFNLLNAPANSGSGQLRLLLLAGREMSNSSRATG